MATAVPLIVGFEAVGVFIATVSVADRLVDAASGISRSRSVFLMLFAKQCCRMS